MNQTRGIHSFTYQQVIESIYQLNNNNSQNSKAMQKPLRIVVQFNNNTQTTINSLFKLDITSKTKDVDLDNHVNNVVNRISSNNPNKVESVNTIVLCR